MAEVNVYYDDRGASFFSPDGTQVWVPKEEAQKYADRGYKPETPDEYFARTAEDELPSAGSAAAAGFLRGATFGLSDYAIPALSGALGPEGAAEAQKQRLRELREKRPGWSTAGEIGSFLVPGGPVSLAGKAVKGASALSKVGRAAAEGAVAAGGLGMSDVALDTVPEGRSSVEHLAIESIEGAAMSGALSLAGLGLGRAFKRAAARRTKPDMSTVEGRGFWSLKQREREFLKDIKKRDRVIADKPEVQQALKAYQAEFNEWMSKRLAGGKGWKIPETGVPTMAADDALAAALQKNGVFAMGEKSGEHIGLLDWMLKNVRRDLGNARRGVLAELARDGLVPALAGGWIGGPVGAALGIYLGRKMLPWAGGVLGRMMGKAAKGETAGKFAAAMGGIFGRAGKPLRLSAVRALSGEEESDLREALDVDPAEYRQENLEAYLGAGIESEDAEALADFQARRHQALARAVATGDRAVMARALDAVADPGGIVTRMAHDQLRPGDVDLLMLIAPALYQQLRSAAEEALELHADGEMVIPLRRLETLRRLVRDPAMGRLTMSIQAAHAATRAQQQQQQAAVRRGAQFGKKTDRTAAESAAASLYGE